MPLPPAVQFLAETKGRGQCAAAGAVATGTFYDDTHQYWDGTENWWRLLWCHLIVVIVVLPTIVVVASTTKKTFFLVWVRCCGVSDLFVCFFFFFQQTTREARVPVPRSTGPFLSVSLKPAEGARNPPSCACGTTSPPMISPRTKPGTII
jgi:hypothetical protein